MTRIRDEGRGFGKSAFGSMGTYLSAAFGFVTGLAWNNAIQALISYYVPEKGSSVAIQFIYAITLTILVAAGTYAVTRITRRDDEARGPK